MGQELGVLGTPRVHFRPWKPHLSFWKWGGGSHGGFRLCPSPPSKWGFQPTSSVASTISPTVEGPTPPS